MEDNLGLVLLLVVLLVLVNGFFAAAEIAFLSFKKNKLKDLKEKKDKKSKALVKVSEDTTNFLSTIQVAITLAGFMSSALAGSRLSDNFAQMFINIGVPMSETVAMVIVTFLLSYFTLVFGELVPKRIALNHAYKLSLFAAPIIYVTMIVTRPFVWLLSQSTKGVLRLFGQKMHRRRQQVTEEDIRELIVTGHVEGLYNREEKQMMENIFRFDDLPADMIMTPRTDVYAIDLDDGREAFLDGIISSKYSRIPVYNETIDQIKGIVHVKDVLIQAKEKGFDDIDIDALLREPYFVPDHVKINVLFRNMQKKNQQLAILVDEYGGVEGIVTVEDLVEEIVGNIYDEYDEQYELFRKVDDNQYVVDGSLPIQDLNRFLGLNVDEDNDEFDTLSGLIIYQLGFIPEDDYDEPVVYGHLTFRIKSMHHNRIEKVLLTVNTEEESESSE